ERAVVGAHSARVLPHVRLRCSRWRDRRDLHSFPTRRSSDLAGLREGFPEACLNALLLAPDGLYVICSAGSAAPPLAAFAARGFGDRKSTRLNSSHVKISYAVFCLKKKNSGEGRLTRSLVGPD